MNKKNLPLVLLCASIVFFLVVFSGCNRSVNYLNYVSERRSNVFLYEDDGVNVKIQCSEREQPFCADGYKGNMCDVIEIFVTLPKNYDEVEVNVENFNGEMNYEAVENRYYLSYSAKEFAADGVDVTLKYGGESKTYKALSVKHAGVMSCDDAVKCVIEHDKELFASLTQNRLFDGEIFVRLLHDDGCYYYVGVCAKDKSIKAFLLDGEKGKIIATKQLQG